MYWRRSLLVTGILLVLGFGASALSSGFISFLTYTSDMSVSQIVPFLTAFNLVVSGLIHFFVLWWAFSRYSSPVEKIKRSGSLRAEDVIGMMNEDELAALRERLLPPSQRDSSLIQ